MEVQRNDHPGGRNAFDMDIKTLWVCLVAGGLLFVYSLRLLYRDGDWTLLLISGLIIGFTFTSMAKKKQKKD